MDFDTLMAYLADGYKVEFSENHRDIALSFAVSYIKQVNKYRIDVRADAGMVRREHHTTASAFRLAVESNYRLLELPYEVDFGLS